MSKYLELKYRHQKEVEDFPMGFAFDAMQFAEMKKKLGVRNNRDLISIGSGGYIRAKDKQDYMDMFDRIEAEIKEAKKDPDFCYEMFKYELANHEYYITMDLGDTLFACGVSFDEINSNKMMFDALKRAEKDYLKEVS